VAVIRLHNETFFCNRRMDGETVVVTIDAGVGVVACQLQEGATGAFTLLAQQYGAQDVVKGGVGVRDLTIQGYAIGHPGPSAAHQDAVQIMGGRGIHFEHFHALLGAGDGRHSAFFVSTGVEALDPCFDVLLEDGIIAGPNAQGCHIADDNAACGVRRSMIYSKPPAFEGKNDPGVINEGNVIRTTPLSSSEWEGAVAAAYAAYPDPGDEPPGPTCEDLLAEARAALEDCRTLLAAETARADDATQTALGYAAKLTSIRAILDGT
jgi:hypothetical protein